MRFLIPLLFLTSCTSVHISQGLIDPAFGLHLKSEAGDLSALHTSIQVEQELLNTDNFVISIGTGPSMTSPLDGRSDMYGAEISNRITWKVTDSLQPYIYHSHGIHYHEGRWYHQTNTNPVQRYGSDSQYELSTRIGAGLAIPATDRLLITIDYSWIHFSNGKSMLGDKTRQFFHLPKATTNDGFEGGAIFIGVQYEF